MVEQEPSHAGFVAMKILDSLSRQDILEFVENRIGADIHHRVRNSGTQNRVPIEVLAGTLDNVPRN